MRLFVAAAAHIACGCIHLSTSTCFATRLGGKARSSTTGPTDVRSCCLCCCPQVWQLPAWLVDAHPGELKLMKQLPEMEDVAAFLKRQRVAPGAYV